MIDSLRRHSAFRTLYLGQLISQIGDWMIDLIIPLYIYARTDSASATALIFVVRAVPRIGFVVVAGTVADRFDRRRVVIIGHVLSAVAIGAVALVDVGDLPLAFVYIAVLAEGLAAQATFAARSALLPEVLPLEDLVVGNAALAQAEFIARFIGPALAGALVARTGVSAVIGLDVLTFMVAILCIAAIPAHVPGALGDLSAFTGPRDMRREIREGFDAVRRSWAMRGVFTVAVGFWISASVLLAVFVPFGTEHLGVDEGMLGLLLASVGLGAIAFSPAVPRVARRFGNAPVYYACSVFGSLNLILLAATRSTVAAFFLLLTFGFPLTAMLTLGRVQIQTLADPSMLGRISSFLSGVTNAAIAIGTGAVALAAGNVDVRVLIVVAALVRIAFSVRAWIISNRPAVGEFALSPS